MIKQVRHNIAVHRLAEDSGSVLGILNAVRRDGAVQLRQKDLRMGWHKVNNKGAGRKHLMRWERCGDEAYLAGLLVLEAGEEHADDAESRRNNSGGGTAVDALVEDLHRERAMGHASARKGVSKESMVSELGLRLAIGTSATGSGIGGSNNILSVKNS
jgi:hypothetical protein